MPPLGITYLAAVLRGDYDVTVLDAALEGYTRERPARKGFLTYGLSIGQIEERIRGIAPDAVGVSCLYSSQFPQTAEITEAAKRVDPGIVTVIGGTHPSFLPEECLRFPGIDFIVRGEGEIVLRRLFAALNSGTDYSALPGIAFRDGRGVRGNAFAEPLAQVDELPLPDRAALPLERYFRLNLPMGLIYRQSPVINMITSRGCAYNCAFCSSCRFWGNRFRARSVDSVLAEMEYLKRTLGVREIKFFDDNLTCDPRRAKAIFRGMIERGFDFTWNTPNGIDLRTLDEEMIVLMKQSGCYELTLAIESGDESVRKTIINKPLDSETIIRATRLIQRHGIDTYGFFIIGFPGNPPPDRPNFSFYRDLETRPYFLVYCQPLAGDPVVRDLP
jgi:Fe-S oxidoreductase